MNARYWSGEHNWDKTRKRVSVCVCARKRVPVWESARYPSHRSEVLRLLIALTNRLVIRVFCLCSSSLWPEENDSPPRWRARNPASPVPGGRNGKLIGAPACAVILLWKVSQAASQYWLFFFFLEKGKKAPVRKTREETGEGAELQAAQG